MKRLILRLIPSLWFYLALAVSTFAQTHTVSVVNAANFSPFLAPDSIAAGFVVDQLSPGEYVAPLGTTLPVELGEVRAYLDSQPCGLFYVGPRQINFHVPTSTHLGLNRVEVFNRAGEVFVGSIYINASAPSLFTFANNGEGEAAAWYLSFGPQSSTVYAVLYGTGVPQRVNAPFDAYIPGSPILTNGYVALVANGREYPATYAGRAPLFFGEQQINVPLPVAEFRQPRLAYLRACDLERITCYNSNTVVIVVR